MTEKYKPIMTDMFEFIRNHTVSEFPASAIVDLVIERFPMQIAYYKCDADMYREFITQLCEYARFDYNTKK